MAIGHCYGQSWHPRDYWLIAGFIAQQEDGCSTREDELEAKGDPSQRQCPQAVLQQGGRVGRAGCLGQGPLTVSDRAGWRLRFRIRPEPETRLERSLSCMSGVHPEDRTGDGHTSSSAQDRSGCPKLTQSPGLHWGRGCVGAPREEGPSQGLWEPPGL